MNDLTVSDTEPDEAGKGGEGGVFMLANADFVAAVFPQFPEGAFAAVCSKAGDPGVGGWSASRADSEQIRDKPRLSALLFLAQKTVIPSYGYVGKMEIIWGICNFLLHNNCAIFNITSP